ncbi:MAG: hypothetical protein QF464_09000, partial [Myxococcota bacterium]|nr:hypothetical protein [Myxococcota bacterium]
MTSGARQIGSYELLRRIHLSHTAEVFEARPRYGGERVAIKRLLPHALEDPSIRTRFEREIEMATSHDHPGLVRGLEVIAGPAAEGASGDPCLVMALVEGTPLIELLDTRAPIEVPTEDALMHLAHTVATHLLALHEHPDGPMAHGDISGKNIIARADGDFVLLDLGSMA